jgi:cation diffusion facilitator family transporter
MTAPVPTPPGSPDGLSLRLARGTRTAKIGLLVNAVLAVVKLLAGIFGHSYALIADAIESAGDVFSSIFVWRGLRLSARSADERYPFGYGKAEPMAAAAVGLMLVVAAALITSESIQEIRTPHHLPAPFTLIVLLAVVAVKETLFRSVLAVGAEVQSGAVRADAWHHRSDAITSGAAAVGITVALWTGIPEADDWAALVAAGVIAINGVLILRPALAELMDRAPEREVIDCIAVTAMAVPGVLAIEKLRARRAGLSLSVDLHVQADPAMTLHDAHILSGRVKTAIRAAEPTVSGVLVHMEPFETAAAPSPETPSDN